MDGFDSESLYEQDRLHVWHPLTQHQDYSHNHPLVITHGLESTVYDINGQSYLDAAAGLWCVNVGYGRQELIDAALRQMQQLAYYPLTQSHPTAIELATRLASYIPSTPHIYFSNSGSEANETAFKIVRQYWQQQGFPHKTKIISRFRGYHGSTLGALSATGQPERKRNYGPMAPDFMQVSAPYCYRCPFHMQYPSCQLQCAEDFERRIQIEGSDTVAAIIVEPIIAGGGVLTPPPGYFSRLAHIAKDYNVKLIVDEVVTGFGRTGSLFGHELYSIKPDIVTMAKGLASGYMPIGVTAVSDEIFHTFLGATDSGRHLRQVNTFGGHPVACAVAIANLNIIEEDDLVKQAQSKGEYLKQLLVNQLQNLPWVGDIRVQGLLAGIEIITEPETKTPASDAFMRLLGRHLIKQGILAGKATDVETWHNNILIIAPPLVIHRDELEQIVTGVAHTIRQVGQAPPIHV
ncbi:MAG: aspartate aminotransferase family protein [Sulfobacillus thermosulfidooxidans]|uniref:Aspartate aminotransferase family protein n=1 Tax=Sulfobacillus thermosulfidooxidans TaxID=28034 RepID=A0A2T2WUA7_SULTH|nr:MAG: aspartate aminotransferase family protein [Sulfobacillus thermosulfidooxidans]